MVSLSQRLSRKGALTSAAILAQGHFVQDVKFGVSSAVVVNPM